MRFKHCKIESILIKTGLYASEECSTSDNFFLYFYIPHLCTYTSKSWDFFHENLSHTKSYRSTIYDKIGKTKTYTGFSPSNRNYPSLHCLSPHLVWLNVLTILWLQMSLRHNKIKSILINTGLNSSVSIKLQTTFFSISISLKSLNRNRN